MSGLDVLLRDATQAQLLEELVRRQNKATREQPPEQWCDDCVHFKASTTATEKYNPCQKRHAMDFYFPQDFEGPHGTCGYYRTVCPDRKPLPAPELPPPPPPPPLTWDHPDYRQEPPPRGKPKPA